MLMLFDQDGRSPDDEQIREYLQQHDLAPRKQYEETRDATRYDVYYFGHCYLEGHLESLTRMASGTQQLALLFESRAGVTNPVRGEQRCTSPSSADALDPRRHGIGLLTRRACWFGRSTHSTMGMTLEPAAYFDVVVQ